MRKFKSASQKKRLQEEQALLDKTLKRVGFYHSPKKATKLGDVYQLLTTDARKELEQYRASMVATGQGNCSAVEPKVYTGKNLLGIATMHKSNMVPVFSTQDAEDIARMRR